jgi:hypothetical protein
VNAKRAGCFPAFGVPGKRDRWIGIAIPDLLHSALLHGEGIRRGINTGGRSTCPPECTWGRLHPRTGVRAQVQFIHYQRGATSSGTPHERNNARGRVPAGVISVAVRSVVKLADYWMV